MRWKRGLAIAAFTAGMVLILQKDIVHDVEETSTTDVEKKSIIDKVQNVDKDLINEWNAKAEQKSIKDGGKDLDDIWDEMEKDDSTDMWDELGKGRDDIGTEDLTDIWGDMGKDLDKTGKEDITDIWGELGKEMDKTGKEDPTGIWDEVGQGDTTDIWLEISKVWDALGDDDSVKELNEVRKKGPTKKLRYEIKKPVNLPKQPKDCPARGIGPAHLDNLRKIKSYEFPGAEPYLTKLFDFPFGGPGNQELLAIVTAVSSSHMEEAMLLLENLKFYSNSFQGLFVFYIYDIGLTEQDRNKLEGVCKCSTQPFPFDDFPPHVRKLKGYAWKPIIIQLVARQTSFIIWLDTSVRFKQNGIMPIIEKAKKLKVMAAQGYNSVASRTTWQTFQALGEDPCAYGKVTQMQAAFIVLYITEFVRDYFLYPWVGCALSPGCMVPSGDPYNYLECINGKNKQEFHLCHRFDQSVMNILMYRMFNKTVDEHVLKFGLYKIERLGSNLV